MMGRNNELESQAGYFASCIRMSTIGLQALASGGQTSLKTGTIIPVPGEIPTTIGTKFPAGGGKTSKTTLTRAVACRGNSLRFLQSWSHGREPDKPAGAVTPWERVSHFG